MRKNVELTCVWCGCRFLRGQAKAKQSKLHFCCREHQRLHTASLMRTVKLTCKMCGKEFEAPASDIGRVFCGRACSRRSFMGTPPWMRKARG